MTRTKVTIGLTNPKSPTNVGAVMRASGCYQVDEVCYTGQRYARASKFQTDTKKISSQIPLNHVDNLLDKREEGTQVVCIELVEGAVPLPHFEHPDNALYIFGPEDGSISQHVIEKADQVVYIPTIGCMNLAATVNVLLYDRLAKSADMVTGDELIRRSRDNRNNLVVK